MNPAPTKASFFRSFLTWFIVFFSGLWLYETWFKSPEVPTQSQAVQFTVEDDSVTLGNLAVLRVKNDSQINYVWPAECVDSALRVERLVSGQRLNLTNELACDQISTLPQIFPAGESTKFSLSQLHPQVFRESGQYQITLEIESEDAEDKITLESPMISYGEPGFFRRIFRMLISRPLFNGLVGLVNILPGHSLGGAIILLTLFVRILLYYPNQRALKSQRRLNLLQPKIEELRQKYSKSQQQMAMKMMELYRSHKINPLSSLWPILLQFPILIGMYFVIREGLSPHLEHLLYNVLSHSDLSQVDLLFAGLNLSEPNRLVLPILVAAAQWGAIRLSFVKQKKSGTTPAGHMAKMQKFMQWGLPIMIGIFTMTFPSGVGLYWLTSTLLGSVQQLIVNWQLDRALPQTTRRKKA